MLALTLSNPLLAASSRADADDMFNIVVGIGRQHDDNLFRLPAGTPPETALGKSTKSDEITVTTLSLRLKQHYSLQRFELEGNLVDYRYRTFDHLDFIARNYAAAWRWHLTPALHGNLTSDRKEALNNYSDFTAYGTRNIRTDENHRFDAVYEIDGVWRALAGLGQTTRTNSQPFLEEADTQIDSVEGGLRYDFRSGSSLSYVMRSGRGEYFKRDQPLAATQFDTAFDQRENELRLIWRTSVKTTIDARAAYLEREHDHFGQRDYAGTVGNLNLDWKITDKTTLTAGLGRELSSYQSATSSYASTDRFALGALWQISGKTALRGRYEYAQRDYHGAIVASPLGERRDTLRNYMIGLEWRPLRALTLNATLQKDKRGANQPGLGYSSTQAGISAQFSF